MIFQNNFTEKNSQKRFVNSNNKKNKSKLSTDRFQVQKGLQYESLKEVIGWMPQNIKIYKFLFRAHITTFDLKANISSPLIVTWKRSNETASTEPVEMVSGKADINQTLTLPVNMYFQLDQQKFQEKKSSFSFTMRSPKGDKQAGVVHVNLAAQVNDKKQTFQSTFTLQKCPVKNSQVHISISAQCIGEKDHDTMSQNSFFNQQSNPSTLSIESHYTEEKRSKLKDALKPQDTTTQPVKINQQPKPTLTTAPSVSTTSQEQQQKDRKIKQLQQLILSLKQQNKKLKSQLTTQKQLNKKLSSSQSGSSPQTALINTLKEQLLKGKSIQDKLQSEIDSYRQENVLHEKQLQTIRQKMDKIYQTFCKQFDIEELEL